MKAEAKGYQVVLANMLAGLALANVLLHLAFLVIDMLLLMELYQLDPRVYFSAYAAPAMTLVITWIATHTYFVERYKPSQNGDEATRVPPSELARARSMQYAVAALVLKTISIGTVFLTKLHDPETLGDMHVVQNGMDTKSAVYTLWLSLVFGNAVGSVYVLANSFYLFDTYLRGFKKALKEKQ